MFTYLRENRKKVIGILFIALLVLAIPLTVLELQRQQEIRSRASEAQVAFRLEPQTLTISPSETATIELNLENTNYDISGVDIVLNFSSSVFEMIEFKPSEAFTSLQNKVDNTNGTLTFTAVNISDNMRTGPINLGRITFRAKQEGQASVGITQSAITASGQENALITDVTNTGTYVVAIPTVPVATAAPTPVITCTPVTFSENRDASGVTTVIIEGAWWLAVKPVEEYTFEHDIPNRKIILYFPASTPTGTIHIYEASYEGAPLCQTYLFGQNISPTTTVMPTPTGVPPTATPSPAATNTPVPTATPTTTLPTPTPTGPQTYFNIPLKITTRTTNQPFTITILDGANNKIFEKQVAAEGQEYDQENQTYTSRQSINTTTIETGDFTVRVKPKGHLAKVLPGIYTKDTLSTASLPALTFVAGDVNDDNKIDIKDYNLLLACFGDKADTTSCDGKKENADLNGNGTVDEVDFNIFIRGILVREGD